MKIDAAELQVLAARTSQYPEDGLPEFLLVGRSNVGKSSFINSIVQRKNIAHTSSTPGKTQTLNFYIVNNRFYLVDAPGYGYAQVNKETQKKETNLMFEYIKGRIADLTPTLAVIETNQIGFSINISLNTYSAIDGLEDATLYIYESIREDAFTLYGFSTKEERDLFLLLISVSGVGATSARMILSAYTVPELQMLISTENVKQLKSIKGIGSKTAERIIVDLKDKVQKLSGEIPAASPVNNNKQEALAALVVLGFNQAAASKVVDAIAKDNPTASIELLIKEALNRLR